MEMMLQLYLRKNNTTYKLLNLKVNKKGCLISRMGEGLINKKSSFHKILVQK
jgi:hypothetical protein